MIRCIRIWTNEHGDSSFEEGAMVLPDGKPGDLIGAKVNATSVSFRETRPDQALEWHNDPTPQLVLTLAGTLQFETHDGRYFIIRPGDVLLAEDTKGTGHIWRLIGEEPWRRAYVIFSEGIDLGFTAASQS